MIFVQKTKKISLLFAALVALTAAAQEGVYYTGKTLSNVDYHHGQLAPAIGVHNIQVLRVNREHSVSNEALGWTYNHQPMLCY